jgi:hypothetical protein
MQLCPSHQVEAVGSCTRCGAFVCETCRRWMSEKPFCMPCLTRLGNKPSGEATLALLLATLGLVLWLPGIAAIVLANRELKRVERGEAPEASKDFATLARTLGWFDAVVGAGAIAVQLFRLFS